MASRRRVVAGVLGGAAGVVVLVLVVLALAPTPGGGTVLIPKQTPAPRWVRPAEAPVAAATPGPNGIGGLADPAWIARTAARTGIPARALQAYAGAALAKASSMPSCGLSWNTLAGIGRIESDNGQHGGSTIGSDGTVSPPIYGPVVSGDVGSGESTGEPVRALGPMQLLPQTWRNWHVDANGDGKQDPQNMEDAAMASANYLCRASTALDTEAGWRRAIIAYNDATTYIDSVARAAEAYRAAADG